MIVATGLYLVALFLITLFTEAVFGVNAQSLAYGPIALALIVLLYRALADRPRDFLRRWYSASPTIVPGLLFLAGLAAALPHARDIGLCAKDFVRWTFVWLVFAPVTRALCSSRSRCRLFARAVPLFIFGFGAFAVLSLLTGTDLTGSLLGTSTVSAGGRYRSLYENAGIFAGMLIVGFPLALVPALTEARLWRRLAWALAAVVMVAGMLLSGSRAAVVATLVATVTVGLALRRRWLIVAVAVVVMAGAGLMAIGRLDEPVALARFQHVVKRSGTGMRSLRRRAVIWSRAGDLISRRPVIGLGGSQLRFYQHSTFNRAHNAWLDAWLDGGLLALSAMLLVTATVARRIWHTLARRTRRYLEPTHVALVGACAAVLVGWLVRAGIGSRVDWLPIFMLLSLYWERSDEETRDDDDPALGRTDRSQSVGADRQLA